MRPLAAVCICRPDVLAKPDLIIVVITKKLTRGVLEATCPPISRIILTRGALTPKPPLEITTASSWLPMSSLRRDVAIPVGAKIKPSKGG